MTCIVRGTLPAAQLATPRRMLLAWPHHSAAPFLRLAAGLPSPAARFVTLLPPAPLLPLGAGRVASSAAYSARSTSAAVHGVPAVKRGCTHEMITSPSSPRHRKLSSTLRCKHSARLYHACSLARIQRLASAWDCSAGRQHQGAPPGTCPPPPPQGLCTHQCPSPAFGPCCAAPPAGSGSL